MEDKDFLKKILEGLSKFILYAAPILIGFGASIAYNALKKQVTRKEFFIHLVLSVAVSSAMYELLKNFPTWLPYAGVIVGVCSFFSIQIIEILISSFPDIMKTLLGIFLKKMEDKAQIKPDDVDTNS